MVKGCQRKTIHVKDTESRFYEEAYFVLRPGVEVTGATDSDMIEEALMIADGRRGDDVPKKRSALSRFLIFASGAVFGASLLAALLIIF